MIEKVINVTEEKIIIELTKEELEEIKKKQRKLGRDDVVGYIAFSLKNYKLKMNLGGIFEFIHNLIDFLNKDTEYIPNAFRYTFLDYLNEYRY